ncbi:hypothetical protein PP47_gp28 [Pectobacterium phage PP47]|uniref:Uncharacterized protein n=2 Tax=Pektosvirus TaxID=2732689 RepID=A0A3B8G4H4_9CAUD|nr:hypothetical protein HOR48_gp27 [Pectobacterium phage PP81]YP_009788725.1 hypothetical protein HOR52_gp28 [Pectobacterium phage PP47]APW79764.2 hypothetical protein PP47_gp28 [Pectobacterium phage PP47]AYM47385.1 hypothetical protein PP81_gp27 [Pectobacterium phage PP81]
MRTRIVIEQEIKKLQTELAEVNEIESSRDAAVHILGNLGWRRECGRWVAPVVKHPPVIEFDPDSRNPLRDGDWVQNKLNGKFFRVHRTDGVYVRVQQFSHREFSSLFCMKEINTYHASQFTSVHSTQVR